MNYSNLQDIALRIQNWGYICGVKAPLAPPHPPTHPPTTDPRKRNQAIAANRRITIAPKAPAVVGTRSDDDDEEPPSGDAKESISSSSVESETSDAPLTDFRNRQKPVSDQTASSSNAKP